MERQTFLPSDRMKQKDPATPCVARLTVVKHPLRRIAVRQFCPAEHSLLSTLCAESPEAILSPAEIS
jgi:hypothetical protein